MDSGRTKSMDITYKLYNFFLQSKKFQQFGCNVTFNLNNIYLSALRFHVALCSFCGDYKCRIKINDISAE